MMATRRTGTAPFAVLSLLGVAGACVHHVEQAAPPGRRAFVITCANDFARCEREATSLCPRGFEKTHSQRMSKHDGKSVLAGASGQEFQLSIECDAPTP